MSFDWGTSVPMRDPIEVCVDLTPCPFLYGEDLIAWRDCCAWGLTRFYNRHVLPAGVSYRHDPLRPFLLRAADITLGAISV